MLLITMIGLPRSGKSTYVKESFSGFQIICADDIRLAMGTPFSQPLEPLVWATHDIMLEAALIRGLPTVVDATNVLPYIISKHAALAQRYGYKHRLVMLTTPVSVCIKRNTGEGSVPEAVIRRMAEQLRDKRFTALINSKELTKV